MKKPVRLGSYSPSHREHEPCKDLEPFISRSPETPPLEPKDDYKDDKCPGKTCLEEAEDLARSPAGVAESGGRRSGGRGSAASRAAGTPSGSPSAMPCGSPAKPPPPPPVPTGNYILILLFIARIVQK